MRKSVLTLVTILAAAMFLLCGVVSSSGGTEHLVLTVQVDRPGIEISPLFYGVFFEEINRAGDGGLYAEMVQNRSFEDSPDQPAPWTLVRSGPAAIAMSVDTSRPLNRKNRHALRLDIANVAGGRAGVANDGFHGMALRKGAEYVLSLYARCGAGFTGPLLVNIEGAQGQVYASARVDGIGPAWQQHRCSLTARESSASARLVITAGAPGTLWLDMVSLFPKETWKGRPNGLRPDLADLVARMAPAFIRFPGGCFVEGHVVANAVRWKETIGDIAERPGHRAHWGGFSTDGLGYHEYLQMCEDMKAEPLFVINCGMAHRDHVPLDQMGPWVQDALDAVEYANGPIESRWGAARAKNGHPAPFNLKYLEIGNENSGPLYQERYRLFYDAFKARFPKIHLIANVATNQRPTEMLDEHFYQGAQFFINNADRYDAYDRKGPKIYVGEYAAQHDGGMGNLRAAIGEAAFLTGLERNADVVVMSSYAPLFLNVGYRSWAPDAINFDNSRAYGTPSYHVQQMFGVNRGDVVLPADLQGPQCEPLRGAIGLGTSATQAEFKDIKVTQGGKVLFESKPSDGLAGWRSVRGQWSAQNGVLRQTSNDRDACILVGDNSWSDYTCSLKARKLSGNDGFLVRFRAGDDEARDHWIVGGWGGVRHSVLVGGGPCDTGVNSPIEIGRWYDLRVELKGPRIRCYLDGKLIHDVEPKKKPLYVVASRAKDAGDVILKVVNVGKAAQTAQIQLRGLAGRVQSGVATVLTSAAPSDENSLEQPNKIVPVSRPIADPGSAFLHTFPANSVTVIRLVTGR